MNIEEKEDSECIGCNDFKQQGKGLLKLASDDRHVKPNAPVSSVFTSTWWYVPEPTVPLRQADRQKASSEQKMTWRA